VAWARRRAGNAVPGVERGEARPPFEIADKGGAEFRIIGKAEFVGRLEGVVHDALAREGLKRRVRASMPMFLTAFAVVATSDMIATAPARLARRFAEQFRLDLYEPPIPVESFPLTLVRRANSQADAGLNWLAALLRRLAAEAGEPG
jgi:DNA-binding transcriptional LysR family regulator